MSRDQSALGPSIALLLHINLLPRPFLFPFCATSAVGLCSSQMAHAVSEPSVLIVSGTRLLARQRSTVSSTALDILLGVGESLRPQRSDTCYCTVRMACLFGRELCRQMFPAKTSGRPRKGRLPCGECYVPPAPSPTPPLSHPVLSLSGGSIALKYPCRSTRHKHNGEGRRCLPPGCPGRQRHPLR